MDRLGGVYLGSAKITDDLDELVAFYNHPAEHWVHLPPIWAG